MAVPIANSLTFALTALAGRLLGEEFGSSSEIYFANAIVCECHKFLNQIEGTLWGMSLIVLGVLLCITSK